MAGTARDPWPAVRAICTSLPEVTERLEPRHPGVLRPRQDDVRLRLGRRSPRSHVPAPLVRGTTGRPGGAGRRRRPDGSSARPTSGTAAGSASASTGGSTGTRSPSSARTPTGRSPRAGWSRGSTRPRTEATPGPVHGVGASTDHGGGAEPLPPVPLTESGRAPTMEEERSPYPRSRSRSRGEHRPWRGAALRGRCRRRPARPPGS